MAAERYLLLAQRAHHRQQHRGRNLVVQIAAFDIARRAKHRLGRQRHEIAAADAQRCRVLGAFDILVQVEKYVLVKVARCLPLAWGHQVQAGVGAAQNARIHPAVARMDACVRLLAHKRMQAADARHPQRTVRPYPADHQADVVHMRGDEQAVAFAAQVCRYAALVQPPRRVAQARDFLAEIGLYLPAVPGGAVDGQQLLQLLQHVRPQFRFHTRSPFCSARVRMASARARLVILGSSTAPR